jgi:hypothetical protein
MAAFAWKADVHVGQFWQILGSLPARIGQCSELLCTDQSSFPKANNNIHLLILRFCIAGYFLPKQLWLGCEKLVLPKDLNRVNGILTIFRGLRVVARLNTDDQTLVTQSQKGTLGTTFVTKAFARRKLLTRGVIPSGCWFGAIPTRDELNRENSSVSITCHSFYSAMIGVQGA